MFYYMRYASAKNKVIFAWFAKCFAFNKKNVKANKVAAYCFDMVLQINLFA